MHNRSRCIPQKSGNNSFRLAYTAAGKYIVFPEAMEIAVGQMGPGITGGGPSFCTSIYIEVKAGYFWLTRYHLLLWKTTFVPSTNESSDYDLYLRGKCHGRRQRRKKRIFKVELVLDWGTEKNKTENNQFWPNNFDFDYCWSCWHWKVVKANTLEKAWVSGLQHQH